MTDPARIAEALRAADAVRSRPFNHLAVLAAALRDAHERERITMETASLHITDLQTRLNKAQEAGARLRDALHEALRRGHFDPFFPFASMRRLAGPKRPERTYEEQKAFEAALAVSPPLDEADPDPGAFGGHPYTPTERALGYGTRDDPRFQPPADEAKPLLDEDVDCNVWPADEAE